MSRKRRRQRNSNGIISISILVLVLLAVLGIQIIKLKRQEANYAKQEEQLREQYVSETQRATELAELEEYMKSIEYIEEMAKSKLGLVYDNEIIYKERR